MADDALLIGEVARACGVSADTVRHYERLGVIAPAARDRSGYRRYPAEVIARIRVARRAVALGFTLDELAKVFRKRASGKVPCREVRELAAGKLDEIDARLAELTELRGLLASLLESWDDRLAATDANAPAHLLDSLI
jgi:DNA-binding transcriptional MerR regulator